jgi:hypothetical protein
MGIKRIATSALESVINTVRISPHGAIGLIGAGLLIDASRDGALHAQLPHWAQMTEFYVGLFGSQLAGLGPYGVLKYAHYRRVIRKHGFDARHAHTAIGTYCNRQAYKAAAYALGYREEFDAVNQCKPAYEKAFNWVPEL